MTISVFAAFNSVAFNAYHRDLCLNGIFESEKSYSFFTKECLTMKWLLVSLTAPTLFLWGSFSMVVADENDFSSSHSVFGEYGATST